MGEAMNHDKNVDALSDLYKKWGDKRFLGKELLSADEMLLIAKLSKKQRLWLELFSEMWTMNSDYLFYSEDDNVLNDLISKYIAKEMGDLK